MHWSSTEPSASFEENASAYLSRTKKTKTAVFNIYKTLDFTFNKVYWHAHSRGLDEEESKIRFSCDWVLSDPSQSCTSRQYKCRREEEMIDKEEFESFTDFWNTVLRPGGCAATLAHVFMIDEWISGFSKSGFIFLTHFYVLFRSDTGPTQYVTGFILNVVHYALLFRWPAIHPD